MQSQPETQSNQHSNQNPQTQSTNAIFVIAPYWSSSTWVFDDPSRGLHREPFVSGVPAIINELVKSIPNAREGFRLLFSENPFPGYQAQYKQTRSEYSGTWYVAANGDEGWLCPALFKYYPTAPKSLFVRAEAL